MIDVVSKARELRLNRLVLLEGGLAVADVSCYVITLQLRLPELYFALLADSFVPVGVPPIQLIDEVPLLFLQVLAHLLQSHRTLLILLNASLDILKQILVPGPALDLLYFNLSDLVLKLLRLDRMISSGELLSHLHLLFEKLALEGQGAVLVLQFLNLLVEVHIFDFKFMIKFNFEIYNEVRLVPVKYDLDEESASQRSIMIIFDVI